MIRISNKASDYREYPKTLSRDDFWGQVRRTVNGRPVSEAQIQMIVDAIVRGLNLSAQDVVLDVACGNGALSSRLFSKCASLIGFDQSEYLIEVAKENFEVAPNFLFHCADAAVYVLEEANPIRYTKAVCYGSFSYFDESTARSLLTSLATKFTGLRTVFIGNLPDLSRIRDYLGHDPIDVTMTKDPESQIGIWRTPEELLSLARDCGWRTCTFSYMPESFYASHYRYDCVLCHD